MIQQQSLNLEIETPEVAHGQFSKRCRIIDDSALRHVLIDGKPEYVYPIEDKETQRAVVVFLYQRKLAIQEELAKGFGVSVRSVRNWISRFNEEGIRGLSDRQRSGAPRKITSEMEKRIFELREGRVKVNDIATTLNIGFGTVCRVLYQPEDNKNQCSMEILDGLDKNDSEDSSGIEKVSFEEIEASIEEADSGNDAFKECRNGIKDPLDRSWDRALARLGYIEDAQPLFPESQSIENAGIFLALASSSMNTFVDIAQKVYVSFGAAFYGIRSMFLMLAMMALLRIKNSEQLGRYNPEKLGVILGLDRVPDVKTIRRKLSTIFLRQKSCEFMNMLVDSRPEDADSETVPEIATIYVDGHVKSYYGKFKTGSTHSATRNRVDKAVTDYWVNQSDGTPLIVVPTAFNESMTKVLPDIIHDAKKMCHGKTDERLTVVFDRGGYSALLFEKLIAMEVDIITYNSGTIGAVDESLFTKKETTINKKVYDYEPYSREITLPVFDKKAKQGKMVRVDTGRKVALREILIRREDNGITAILTTIKDQVHKEIASTLFNRWSQENYFKYMKREFALDHLCTYGVENIPAGIDHPNPEYTKLTKDIAKQREIVSKICGKNADIFLENDYDKVEKELKKLKKSKSAKKLKKHLEQIEKLQKMRKNVKERVGVSDFKQLKREGRLFSNVIKIASYHIETELVTLFKKNYDDRTGNARSLIAAMLKCSGTIKTENGKLIITLEKQATPLITKAAEKLCDLLSEKKVKYPGTNLILQFLVEKNRQR